MITIMEIVLQKFVKKYLKSVFPASALITVAGFARPGLLLEIQGVVVIGDR